MSKPIQTADPSARYPEPAPAWLAVLVAALQLPVTLVLSALVAPVGQTLSTFLFVASLLVAPLLIGHRLQNFGYPLGLLLLPALELVLVAQNAKLSRFMIKVWIGEPAGSPMAFTEVLYALGGVVLLVVGFVLALVGTIAGTRSAKRTCASEQS